MRKFQIRIVMEGDKVCWVEVVRSLDRPEAQICKMILNEVLLRMAEDKIFLLEGQEESILINPKKVVYISVVNHPLQRNSFHSDVRD